MGILDDIRNALGLGPNSWDERLAPTIDFTSPDGNKFTAFWRGSPRSKDKKLGIFLYPGLKGNVVQDLEVNSSRFSITFFFEGKDNDKEANRFYAACDENGWWEVIHPVHGLFGLQLISVTENAQPIENGNITEITSEWIEPIDPVTLKTARELAGIIDSGVKTSNLNALQEFVAKVNQISDSITGAIKDATSLVQDISEAAFSPLNAINDLVDSTFNSLQDAINDTLNATVVQAEALAGQTQDLIQLPLLAANSLQSRLGIYGDAKDGYLDTIPQAGLTPIESNKTAVAELALTATVAGLTQIATTSVLKPGRVLIPTPTGNAAIEPAPPPPDSAENITTRAQAVAAAQTIADIFNEVVEELDKVQDRFVGVGIADQFFTQTRSYTSLAQLVGNAVQFLLISSFDLKIEKRFVLDRPRAPLEIAVTEYGDIGENDSNYDLFIQSNGLKGNEILLLPAGREVVIYV